MLIRPVQTVVVPVAFPSAVDAMVVVAPEFALVARLFGNPTKGLALVLPARTGHIPVTEPRLGNALVLGLGQMLVRLAVELLLCAGPIAAIVQGGFVTSIPTVVLPVADECPVAHIIINIIE
jgi:hypothetical protein